MTTKFNSYGMTRTVVNDEVVEGLTWNGKYDGKDLDFTLSNAKGEDINVKLNNNDILDFLSNLNHNDTSIHNRLIKDFIIENNNNFDEFEDLKKNLILNQKP